ncbi:MAG: hypothetical protein AAGI03_06730 [Pseudomonadota bacterium]
MDFVWPEETRSAFGRQTICAQHLLHESPLATDEGLVELLDRYPRERLGVYTFPPHGEGRVGASHGRAPDITGEDLLNAVKTGKIWLNLRAVNQTVSEWAGLGEVVFRPLEAASGQTIFKQDVGVLISSPNIHVHYHLDIPLVCLVQLRGSKTLTLYPPKAPFAPPDQIEAIALRDREADITYERHFENEARSFELTPGQAITWPQAAPHRVQNGPTMNVSLSCEFMTVEALLRANAIYTNGVLRRSLGLQPSYPLAMDAGNVGKALLARALQVFRRAPRADTPMTFEVQGSGDLIDLGRAA